VTLQLFFEKIGILFMTFIGRRWLPNRSPIDRYGWDARYQSALSDLYSLQDLSRN